MASQLHVVVGWDDVATVQWEAAVADPNNPEQIISNGAVGADLGLWYFRKSWRCDDDDDDDGLKTFLRLRYPPVLTILLRAVCLLGRGHAGLLLVRTQAFLPTSAGFSPQVKTDNLVFFS